MKKRIFSLLLCLALAFALMPAAAWAAPAEINLVKIEIGQPYAGEKPDYAPAVSANCALVTEYPATGYIGGVRWRDRETNTYLSKDDPFIEGHAYTLRIALRAVNGVFRNDGLEVDVAFTVNGGEKQAAGNLTASGYDDPGQYLSIHYDFPAVEQRPKTAVPITKAYVKITEPMVGKTPDLSPTAVKGDFAMAAPGYAVKSVQWMKKNSGTGLFEDMAADEKFEADRQYAVKVSLRAETGEGYCFPDAFDACWFNSADDKGRATRLSGDQTECEFYKSWDAAIALVEYGTITVEAPVAGELAQHDPVFSEGLTISGSFNGDFYNGVKWSSEKGVLNWDEPFEEGVVYTLTVELTPMPGYLLLRETSGDNVLNWVYLEVNGTHDGVETTVAPNQLSAVLTYTFPPAQAAAADVIQSVELSCTAPAAGAHPDFTVEILSGEILPITESKDKEVQAQLKEMEAQGMVNGVVWYESGKENYMAQDEVFEEGKSYYCIALFMSKAGYQFSPNVHVLVNGELPHDVDGSKTILNVTYMAVAGPAKQKTLQSIAVTTPPDKTEYTAGETFDLAGMAVTAAYDDETAAEVTGWSVTPETLAENDKAVTVSYTEGDVTVTAEMPVTVKPAEKKNTFKDVFETDYFYDAVMWAYYAEPQVTNGIHADEFGPDRTVTRGQAVTFLWRAMGCPEPETAENPFEDVKENQYYYKAVLWANEKGITNGTSATRFTPNQTCSTAHIITFLYRTITGKANAGWYEVAEAWAGGARLLDGLDIEVKPGVDCARCDVVLFLYRELAK